MIWASIVFQSVRENVQFYLCLDLTAQDGGIRVSTSRMEEERIKGEYTGSDPEGKSQELPYNTFIYPISQNLVTTKNKYWRGNYQFPPQITPFDLCEHILLITHRVVYLPPPQGPIPHYSQLQVQDSRVNTQFSSPKTNVSRHPANYKLEDAKCPNTLNIQRRNRIIAIQKWNRYPYSGSGFFA